MVIGSGGSPEEKMKALMVMVIVMANRKGNERGGLDISIMSERNVKLYLKLY